MIVTLHLVPGQIQTIDRGRYIHLLSASAGEPVLFQTNTMGGDDDVIEELIPNVGARFPEFRRALVTSKVEQTVVIMYSMLEIQDNRLGINDNTLLRIDAHIQTVGLPVITSTGPNETIALPSNLNRKGFTLVAADDNAGGVWFGGTAVNSGIKLNPGDSITEETKAANLHFELAGDSISWVERV